MTKEKKERRKSRICLRRVKAIRDFLFYGHLAEFIGFCVLMAENFRAEKIAE